MKKKLAIFTFILLFFVFFSIRSNAAETKNYLLEHECTTYGLLPQNNNPVLDWKATSFEYNIKDIPKEKTFYKTRNELIAKYTIKNKSDENTTEEFMLPFFEPANSNRFVYNNSMILVDGNEPELQTRHIYSGIGYEYYFHNKRILDSYYESDNLNTNTNVRVIKAKINSSLVEKDASFPVLVRTTLSDKNKAVSTGLSTDSEDLDLQMHGIVYRVDKTNPRFELYFFGDTPKYVIESNNLIIEEFDMTFLEYAQSTLPEQISLLDWYNILAKRLTSDDFLLLDDFQSLGSIMTVLTFSKDFKPAEQVSIETRLPFYLYNHIYNVNDYKYYVRGYIYSESRNVTVSIKGLNQVLGFGGGQEYGSHNYALDSNEFTFNIDAYSEFVLDEVVRIIFATIMVFLFYVVPMLVMLILFTRRKNKSNLGVLYLQRFLSYTLSFFGLFFLFASPNDLTPAIVLLCGLGVITLITLLQNIVRNGKSFNSLIVETMCWAMNIYYLIVNDLETVYINIWIFGFIDFIFILFKIKKTVKMDPALKNYLPVGILYKFENWIIYLYFSITLCTTFITSEVLEDRFEIFFVPLPFIFIFYFLGMILRYRFFFLKPFREFYKDLDLEALEKKIQKRQELSNLHPETINFYNILLAQHCLAHNMEKTREYIKKTYLPQTKGYVLAYRGMNMRYGQTKEELEHGYEVLKREYYNNKLALKSFDKFYKFWLPYYGTNPSQDIKKVYNYHRKNNEFSNAISLFVLIYYYKNENNISKVEELKKEFVSKYGILTEFINDLNQL